MRKETINIYSIDELSEEAKRKALEEYRSNNYEVFWQNWKKCIII